MIFAVKVTPEMSSEGPEAISNTYIYALSTSQLCGTVPQLTTYLGSTQVQ